GKIWILDLTRGGIATRFTFGPEDDRAPVWSPDGGRIVFASGNDLFVRPTSGAGDAELLLKSPTPKVPHDWSPDGRFIVFTQVDPKTLQDIWLLPLAGGGRATPFLQTPFNEGTERISPDGKWIAYTSMESGTATPDVHV